MGNLPMVQQISLRPTNSLARKGEVGRRVVNHSWMVKPVVVASAPPHWQVVAARVARAGEQGADYFRHSLFLAVEVEDQAIVALSAVGIVSKVSWDEKAGSVTAVVSSLR